MPGTTWVRPALPIRRLAIGAAAGLAFGLALSLREGGPGPLVTGVVLTVLNVVLVARALGRLDPARRGPATGRTVTPPEEVTGEGVVRRWAAAGSVPCAIGRANAAAGLAVLSVGPGWFTLRLRPRGLAWFLFGAEAVRGAAAAGVEAFPVRGRLGNEGVGLKPPGQPESYLWVKQREQVLAALAEGGFAVAWEERRTA